MNHVTMDDDAEMKLAHYARAESFERYYQFLV